MFVMFRAVTYATFFIGLLLVYLPSRILSQVNIVRPTEPSWQQIVGAIVATAGALAALWCVGAFVWIGKGTPAPFDPPRRLVIRGPYRFVRNPMYTGAGLALAGAALFYASAPLLVYACIFLLVAHLLVMLYEEPTLRRNFGQEYEAYCHRVRRWWPSVRTNH